MAYIAFILDSASNAFWFYLPVLIANLLLYTVFSILSLDIPLDLYKTIHNHRIIGHSRSIAGFFMFTFIALFIGIIQHRAVEALYLGIGGTIGCYSNSFLKRRLNLPPGTYFFFLDQTDFILFSSLIYITHFNLSLNMFISGIILTFILHHLVNLLRTSWEKMISPKVKI